jgi:GGDEF domain-containing protein
MHRLNRLNAVMTQARFYDAASGLLTREAFTFMVDHQLMHAQRAQEFLTLVVIVAEREWRELVVAADEWIIKELARLVRYTVRSTDLLARTADGMLSLLLVGIDLERANGVIERLNTHIRRYDTSPALQISMGAACCPTHSIRADELLKVAIARRSISIAAPATTSTSTSAPVPEPRPDVAQQAPIDDRESGPALTGK